MAKRPARARLRLPVFRGSAGAAREALQRVEAALADGTAHETLLVGRLLAPARPHRGPLP
jgi:hypothetical protein